MSGQPDLAAEEAAIAALMEGPQMQAALIGADQVLKSHGLDLDEMTLGGVVLGVLIGFERAGGLKPEVVATLSRFIADWAEQAERGNQ